MLEEGADISWATVRHSTTHTWGQDRGGLSFDARNNPSLWYK